MNVWKYALAIIATGILLSVIVIYTADRTTADVFTPFSR